MTNESVETILLSYRDSLATKKPSTAPVTTRIWEYTCENLHDPDLTVGSISDRLRLHSSYKQRFHFDTGTTLKSFIVTHRVNSAVHLLRNTDISLFEVCFSVGFDHYSTFRKAFKRVLGCCPSSVRRALVYIGLMLFFSGA